MSVIDRPERAPRPLVAPARPAPEPVDGAFEGVDLEAIHWADDLAHRGVTSAGRAIALVLAGLALAALLCADTLVQVAERQPFGTTRDVALSVTRPIRSVSHAVGLHLPRLWLAELTGNAELPTSAAGEDLDVPSATVTTAPPTTPTKPVDSSIGATTSTLPPTTTTTLPLRRTPTAEDPLRVVMFGDSLMGHIAVGYQRHVTDPRVHVYSEYHIGTGLARPDVLDWPAYLNQVLPGFNAEVVYLMFGGNDDQDMQLADGTRVVYGTQEWASEYARRVALTMDVAAQNDRTVVWLNLPAMNRPRLNQAKDLMNAIIREQAGLRPRVVYLDLYALLTPDGVFHEYLPGADGSPVLVRASDGVHVSIPGGEMVAPALLAAIATDWNLVAPPTTAPPPATVPPAPP
jgi:hypothetical protein